MRFIQISEDKKESLSDMCSQILRLGGKMMDCIEDLEDGEMYDSRYNDGYEMGERRSRGRMNMRSRMTDDDYYYPMGMRSPRSRYGR